MKKNHRLLLLAAVMLALFSSVGCDKLRARDQLNKGVKSYKDNHYEQAIDHFQKAVNLDPALINARMYLATAYVSQYIPGVDSPDNLRTAQQAIDEYQKVIDANPSRDQKVNSAKGIAYLYLNEKSGTTLRSITAWLPIWTRTILSPTTLSASSTGPRASSRAWKSARNWA